MNATEAYKLFVVELPNLTVVSCYDYASLFVFEAIPKASVDSKHAREAFDTLYSVDKQTGKVGRFKPFLISVEEYENGKPVHGYKPLSSESPAVIRRGKVALDNLFSR